MLELQPGGAGRGAWRWVRKAVPRGQEGQSRAWEAGLQAGRLSATSGVQRSACAWRQVSRRNETFKLAFQDLLW